MTTGPLHWELLQRGRYGSSLPFIHFKMFKASGFRAVDNQVYFSMCSPARDMSVGYHAVIIPIILLGC